VNRVQRDYTSRYCLLNGQQLDQQKSPSGTVHTVGPNTTVRMIFLFEFSITSLWLLVSSAAYDSKKNNGANSNSDV
jgi:hypothetical protein